MNGRLAHFFSGRRLVRVRFGRPRGKRFTLQIVAVLNNGKKAKATWRYNGCKRTVVKAKHGRKA